MIPFHRATQPPAPVIGEDQARSALAALALLGEQPTDRALEGWSPGSTWLRYEIEVLRAYAKPAAREAG